jgi:uncharacterized protein (DUF934 family)
MSDLVERLRAPLGIMECAERDMPDGTKERRWFVALEAADEITRLTEEVERLRAAIVWIEPPFVDEFTSAAELRQRIGFCVADAKRAALPQPTTEAPAP